MKRYTLCCVQPVTNLIKRLLITFGSYFSIEVQSLIVHGAQPGTMYGIVYAAYSIESKLQIGLYALGNDNHNDHLIITYTNHINTSRWRALNLVNHSIRLVHIL